MIKIIHSLYIQQNILRLYFSDNSYGDYDFATFNCQTKGIGYPSE